MNGAPQRIAGKDNLPDDVAGMDHIGIFTLVVRPLSRETSLTGPQMIFLDACDTVGHHSIGLGDKGNIITDIQCIGIHLSSQEEGVSWINAAHRVRQYSHGRKTTYIDGLTGFILQD